MSSAALEEHWDRAYERGVELSAVSGGVIDRVISFLPAEHGFSCLDIGCGSGQLSRELHHRRFSVLGIDVSGSAIGLARARTSIKTPDLRYQQLNIETEIVHETFSLIACKLVYAFVKDKSALIERVDKMLKPGGIFVVITPNTPDVPDEKQNIAVDHTQILNELGSHFEVHHFREKNLSLYICQK